MSDRAGAALETGWAAADIEEYDDTIGILLTHWTARVAFLLYSAALAAWIVERPRAARSIWTAGFLVYVAHVAAAFHFYHHWSHDAAYRETARQTNELFGVNSGSGLYWNYCFSAIWAADAVRLWRNRKWDRRIVAAIHCFMAFLFFNATVVFASGWVRWMGIAVMVALAVLWLARRQTTK